MTDSADERLAKLIRGYVISQIIASAAKFNIPDQLAEKPMSSVRLAELTGIRILELRRYLRALAGLGILDRVDDDTYLTSDAGLHLCRNTGSLHGQAVMSGEEYYDAWRHLDYALRTGESAFEHSRGQTLWQRFAERSGSAESFTRTMRWNMERSRDEICSLYNFPDRGVIADIGAGDATLLIGILERYVHLRGIAFEQAAVAPHTAARIYESGLAGRCEVVTGDFLKTVPKTADVYLLKAVLHNWGDDRASLILNNCREAIGGRAGRVVVIEQGPNDADELGSAIRDLTMLVLFGGADRNPGECAELLNKAGFATSPALFGRNGLFIIEASPAKPTR